ncbi:hypothetical protein NEMBOFW57_001218 [Staphylotrichum longicolle]|uniref:Uncharacterized protein n=1 Tax=Staphylotrichum longicolle TaxID=669026 RepID=A0AAD4F0R8_9PEZI|nr:hypothetical protein NEMBOFW57_001218 [Staphylotrichum longicolle]
MATTSSTPQKLTFGIEIELLLKPRDRDYVSNILREHGFQPAIQPTSGDTNDAAKTKNRDAIRKGVVQMLLDSDIEAGLKSALFDIWTAKEEGSLTEVADPQGGDTTLNENYHILLTKGCSMHVHVAPKPRTGETHSGSQWTVGGLRNLVRATGIFDEAIMKIMPADRKHNIWARSNFRRLTDPTTNIMKGPSNEKLRDAFEKVSSKGWKPFFDIIDQPKSKLTVLNELGLAEERQVSMNFASIAMYGTVEFRRPPGVKSSAEAQKWAAFAVAFVSASFNPYWDYRSWANVKRYATVEELQSFISSGIQLLGWPQGVLDPKTLVENTSSRQPPEYHHAEEIMRKLAKANKESAFEQKPSGYTTHVEHPARNANKGRIYPLKRQLQPSAQKKRAKDHLDPATQALKRQRKT